MTTRRSSRLPSRRRRVLETLTIAAGSSYNYFGLYWGSIDDYNWLKFYDGDTLLGTITGLDVIAAGTALGDQIAPARIAT